jgi:hypothetical protein
VVIVPSDRVWEGCSRSLQAREKRSSWSFRNQALVFNAYTLSFGEYVEKFPGKIAADWHSHCLDEHPAVDARESEIPLENINSKILFISSKKDEVWPSLIMSRQFISRLQAEGKAFESDIFPEAGHSIVGDRSFQVFLFPKYANAEGESSILETGYATIETQRRTVEFLKKNLLLCKEKCG